MKNLILFSLIFLLFSGCTLTNLSAKGSKNHQITILDQATLEYPKKGGIPFSELSDLSYDSKNKKLYMIGDKGYLYTFSALFSNKIGRLKYLHAYPIKDQKNRSTHPDSEGLTLNQDNQLIVSFEKQPQISKVTPKGKIISNYKLPKNLRGRNHYKNANSIFEAVAYHPHYGILTASEYPINKQKNSHQSIYSLKGKVWHFRTQPYANSAITAMEIMDDNNILLIERSYNGLSKPFIITLKKIYLNKCNRKKLCQSQVLATFNSAKGWGYNNFEGLAKVGKNRYLMVSDNNRRSLLPTTLLYFKVNP